jgi:hypothetical protein
MDDIFTVEEDIAEQMYEKLRMKVTARCRARPRKRKRCLISSSGSSVSRIVPWSDRWI